MRVFFWLRIGELKVSDSIRGAKGPGYEYWGRRSHFDKASKPGKLSKQWTHRRERQQGKKEAKDKEQE